MTTHLANELSINRITAAHRRSGVSARANRMAARKYPTLNKYYYAKKGGRLWKTTIL